MILTLLCWSPDIDFCHSENSESESLWSELWVEETKSLGNGGALMRPGRGNVIFSRHQLQSLYFVFASGSDIFVLF